MVTDGGEYVDEPLQSSRRSEALHRSLSSSKGQMRIFRPVVEALMRAMLDRGHGLTRCCSVRAELVGDDALGRNALLSQQAPQQTSRGLAVALGLQNLVENIALLIDRAPEPMFFPAMLTTTSSRCQMSLRLGRLRVSRRTKSWPNLRPQRRTVS